MQVDMQPSTGLKNAIEHRRVVRSFLPDPIPEVILKEILNLGVRAPSGYNLQPWRFILVKLPENKERLKACAFNQRQIGEAPVVLICCGDRRVAESEYIESVIKLGKKEKGWKRAYADNLRSQIPGFFEQHPSFSSMETWTNRQTMLAVAQMSIVAKSFGVDSCFIEVFVAQQVKEAFNIPEEVDVCCLLALGYEKALTKPDDTQLEIQQIYYGETYGQLFQI